MTDLSIFFEPGDVVELRALGKLKGAVQSGYYKNIKKFEEDLNVIDKAGEHKGIYFVLNKINPALYARRPDSLAPPREAIATTSDADIIRRRWLPVDFDPIRPADISSSDEEHEAAIQRAKDVREHLRALGWPEPLLADSGNGAHLLYKIDLPNNESATQSVELVLKALDALFSDEVIKIDSKNYNASRIWKAYGTVTRKGANVADRPWRRSQMLEVPESVIAVPEELLAGLGWGFRQKEDAEHYGKTDGDLDLEQWLSAHGLDVAKSKSAHGGGRMYILDQCPWDSSHVDRSAWAVQFPSGAIAAGCHHNGCSGKGWKDLWRLFETQSKPKAKKQKAAARKEPLVEPSGDEPTILAVYPTDAPGSIGVTEEDGAVKQVKTVKRDDGSTARVMEWVSDCALYIHTQTIADGEREFIFEGHGAVDKEKVRFTMAAEDLADSKKFKGILINAFGAANRVGQLTFEMVQRMTLGTIKRRRLCVPTWVDGAPMIPGLKLRDDIEFKFLDMIPAEVYDGDLEKAKKALASLLDVAGYSPIIITAILGAPFYARCFSNDRFGIGIWGRTGSQKTTMAKKCMSVYGTGYNEDANLLKHGKIGSTAVGETEILASAGFLPQIIDNVKSVDQKDVQQYVMTVHSVIEGKDKVRGKKDGGVRESKAFLCTPIITGEIKPDEASTSARILNLDWAEPEDKSGLNYAQGHLSHLPVIGYHWLKFLAEYGFDVSAFEKARGKKTDEFNKKNYVNSGRLATIYSLLRATWGMLCDSPLADIFEPRTDRFLGLLDKAVAMQGAMVSEETEVAKFMDGVHAIIATQPHLIQQFEHQSPDEGRGYAKDVIGRWIGEDLFLVPVPTLAALKRLGVFTQIPTERSITSALEQAGFLVPGQDGKRKDRQRMNDQRVYGWRLKASSLAPETGGLSSPNGDDKNDSSGSIVPLSPLSPAKKREHFSQAKNGGFPIESKNSGDIGDKPLVKKDSIVIDSDNTYNILSPDLSPSCPLVPEKRRIWEAIHYLLTHAPSRIDNRLGFLPQHLSEKCKIPVPDLEKYLMSKGWTKDKIPASDLEVWLAPAKTLEAYGLE